MSQVYHTLSKKIPLTLVPEREGAIVTHLSATLRLFVSEVSGHLIDASLQIVLCRLVTVFFTICFLVLFLVPFGTCTVLVPFTLVLLVLPLVLGLVLLFVLALVLAVLAVVVGSSVLVLTFLVAVVVLPVSPVALLCSVVVTLALESGDLVADVLQCVAECRRWWCTDGKDFLTGGVVALVGFPNFIPGITSSLKPLAVPGMFGTV